MRSYKIEGLVLKRSDVGETDRLITFFTRHHGKLSVLAKGVRRPNSRRAGSLELFNEVQASVHHTKGDLDILGEVELVNSQPAWRKHLGRVTVAYQLVEAVDKLTPDGQSHPKIFDLLKQSLSQIGKLEADWKQDIELWLVELLVELGYWPKSQPFSKDIYEFIEDISSRSLNSPKFLKKISYRV